MKMVFYMTGIFYDISSRIHDVTFRTLLLDFNPLANFIYNMRNVLIYESSPVGMWTLLWFFVGKSFALELFILSLIVGFVLNIIVASNIYKLYSKYNVVFTILKTEHNWTHAIQTCIV